MYVESYAATEPMYQTYELNKKPKFNIIRPSITNSHFMIQSKNITNEAPAYPISARLDNTAFRIAQSSYH